MFKKTDSKELQSTITIVLSIIFILLPVSYLLQAFDVIVTERISLGEVVLSMGALILVMFDIMYLMQKENRHFTWFDVILLVMLIVLVLSSVFAKDPQLAQSGTDLHGESCFIMASYIVIAFSASLIKESKNKKILYVALTIVGIIQIVMTFFQVIYSPAFMDEIKALMDGIFGNRALGTVRNPNPFASMMILFAGLELGFFFESKSIGKTIFHVVMFFLYAGCMLLSGTRGAMLGFGIAAIIFVIYVLAMKITTKKSVVDLKKLGCIVGVVLVVGGVFVVVKGEVVSEIIERTTLDIENGRMGEDRLTIWKDVMNTTLDHPVLGIGPSNYVYGLVSNGTLFDEESSFRLIYDAHNRYFQTMVTQGIVGLLAYLSLLGYVYLKGMKKMKDFEDDKKVVYIGLMFGFTGYLIADIFCVGMFSVVPFLYLLIGTLAERESLNAIGLK